jgi:hypothetical protein
MNLKVLWTNYFVKSKDSKKVRHKTKQIESLKIKSLTLMIFLQDDLRFEI